MLNKFYLCLSEIGVILSNEASIVGIVSQIKMQVMCELQDKYP